MTDGLDAHLLSGATTLARCWSVSWRDGVTLGFTDHDLPLSFEGISFAAETGLTASALDQSTGLSVDNTEVLGALNADVITEADIEAGRYDGADVQCWLVNWAKVTERRLLFCGTIGEIRRQGGAFQAELRGLAEALNQSRGRVFQKRCSAVLGDDDCRFDLDTSGFHGNAQVSGVISAVEYVFEDLQHFAPHWFEEGRFRTLAGGGQGLIKRDRLLDGKRHVELWQEMRVAVVPGDMVRLLAGCDKRAETCRVKFDNFLNFRGFPHLPDEDWIVAYPRGGDSNVGGSMNRRGT